MLKKRKIKQLCRKSAPGFTLAEVLISFTIFGLLIGVVTGTLISVFRSHRYIFNSLDSQANLRFILETMTREIKEGSNLNFNPQTKTLSFLNKDGQGVEYFLDQGKMFRREGTEVLPITSESLEITRFDVAGCWQRPNCQPSVTLLFQVKPEINLQDSSFYLQTTITQRRAGI
ncbi:MAG: prepilin-type N-terminal cleavage/methylation domain-containing protein [Patescibacteria group bacterium]